MQKIGQTSSFGDTIILHQFQLLFNCFDFLLGVILLKTQPILYPIVRDVFQDLGKHRTRWVSGKLGKARNCDPCHVTAVGSKPTLSK